MSSSILWSSSPISESFVSLSILQRWGKKEKLQEQLVTISMMTKSSVSFCSLFPFLSVKLLECKEFGIVGGHTGSNHHILQGCSSCSLSSLSLWSTNAPSKMGIKNQSGSLHLQTGENTEGRGRIETSFLEILTFYSKLHHR